MGHVIWTAFRTIIMYLAQINAYLTVTDHLHLHGTHPNYAPPLNFTGLPLTSNAESSEQITGSSQWPKDTSAFRKFVLHFKTKSKCWQLNFAKWHVAGLKDWTRSYTTAEKGYLTTISNTLGICPLVFVTLSFTSTIALDRPVSIVGTLSSSS